GEQLLVRLPGRPLRGAGRHLRARPRCRARAGRVAGPGAGRQSAPLEHRAGAPAVPFVARRTRQPRAAATATAGDREASRRPGAAGPRPYLRPPRRRCGRGNAAVRGVRGRRQAVPGLAAGARDDVAGGRGHAAVPGAAAGGRPPGLRGAHGDRAAVRRLRPGRRGRAGQAHRGAGGRPHRRAPVPARTDPARPQRPVLGMRCAATHAGTAALLLSLLTGAWAPQLSAGETVLQPCHAAQPASTPAEALLAVEIPAGSATKYEIGADGLVYVDRFVSMPVAYPANYGSIP